MKKVNWPDNIRVDGPDLRAVLDLVEEHFLAECQYILGESSSLIHCGVINGMGILVDVGLPSPLQNAIITGGGFVDGARKFVQSTGTTSLDISGVAGTNGSKIWARVAAAKQTIAQEDRVLIVAGVETTQPSYTRQVDVLEFTATTGATPSGSGWALVLTINTWTTYMGYTVPQSYVQNYMWLGNGNLYQFALAVRAEIAELKGVAAADWQQAPTQTIPQLATRMGTAEANITSHETRLDDVEPLASLASTFAIAHAGETDGQAGGEGVHAKALCELRASGGSLAIQAGIGRNFTTISKISTGKYTLTIGAGAWPHSSWSDAKVKLEHNGNNVLAGGAPSYPANGVPMVDTAFQDATHLDLRIFDSAGAVDPTGTMCVRVIVF